MTIRFLRHAWLLAAVAARPCTPSISTNCTQRFSACGHHQDLPVLHARDATPCNLPGGRLKANEVLVVQFYSGTPGSTNCLEIAVRVGECWGLDQDGDSYDCLGLCGVGCAEQVCSNWSRNCLKHDVCSCSAGELEALALLRDLKLP